MVRSVFVRSWRGAKPGDLQSALGPAAKAIAEVIARSQSVATLARLGVDEIQLVDGARTVATAWIDAKRLKGVVQGADGLILCWIRDGEPLAHRGTVPPAIARAVRGLAKVGPATSTTAAAKLVARHVRTIDSRSATLSAVENAQLVAATPELCGAKGLAALWDACDRAGTPLERVELRAGRNASFDVWAWSSLEDGVVFVHGAKRASGIAISQMRVHAMTKTHAGEVAAIQQAWKALKLGKAKRWR